MNYCFYIVSMAITDNLEEYLTAGPACRRVESEVYRSRLGEFTTTTEWRIKLLKAGLPLGDGTRKSSSLSSPRRSSDGYGQCSC